MQQSELLGQEPLDKVIKLLDGQLDKELRDLLYGEESEVPAIRRSFFTLTRIRDKVNTMRSKEEVKNV